jgi:rhodanese-related sulfurtransferase
MSTIDTTHHRTRWTRRLGVTALLAAGLAACSSGASSGASQTSGTLAPTSAAATASPAVHLVDVAAGTALAADFSVIVIDVRTPAEFAEGHLARARLVDFEATTFRDQIATFDRSARYLVYCHSGNRSGQATAIMTELGFSNVSDLDGGISAWTAAGQPIVT